MDQGEFFKFLWEGQSGVVNFFFKNEEGTKTRHYTFPDGLNQMVETVQKASEAGFECYFAPALLTQEGRKKNNFKVSTVAWADFDASPNGAIEPHPSLIVETSPGHIHTYWKLQEPIADASQLEQINKRLAHSYGADDCWDATRLLRVPGTTNQKRDAPVGVTFFNGSTHTFILEEGDASPKHRASLWRPLYYRSRMTHVSSSSFLMEAKGIARLHSINSQPYWEKEESDQKLLKEFFASQMRGGGSSMRGPIMKRVSRIFSKRTRLS